MEFKNCRKDLLQNFILSAWLKCVDVFQIPLKKVKNNLFILLIYYLFFTAHSSRVSTKNFRKQSFRKQCRKLKYNLASKCVRICVLITWRLRGAILRFGYGLFLRPLCLPFFFLNMSHKRRYILYLANGRDIKVNEYKYSYKAPVILLDIDRTWIW